MKTISILLSALLLTSCGVLQDVANHDTVVKAERLVGEFLLRDAALRQPPSEEDSEDEGS